MSREPIRVAIVEDHPVVRRGLRVLLESAGDFEIVGEWAGGAAAVAQLPALRPDVVLMDIRLDGMDGIEATRRLRTILPSARVLILSSYEEEERLFAAIRAGASGYLLKSAEPEDLLNAVRVAAEGYTLMHPAVAQKVLGHLRPGAASPLPGSDRSHGLTSREREVLSLIARGRTNREIAADLCVSEKTVKTHISNIFSKLQVSERTQAALYAVRHGLAS